MKTRALTFTLLLAFASTALLAPAAQASRLPVAANHEWAIADRDDDEDEDPNGRDKKCHQYWMGHCADD